MDPRVQIVLALIAEDLRREPPLTTLAGFVHLSPSRLRHLFKAETGQTPAQHVKFLRLHKAQELLETTFLSVKEIMSSVGISNESHLCRISKRLTASRQASTAHAVTAAD
jgi:AraC family transcriptional regulator of arabinose operon